MANLELSRPGTRTMHHQNDFLPEGGGGRGRVGEGGRKRTGEGDRAGT